MFLMVATLLLFVMSCTSPLPSPDLIVVKEAIQTLENGYAENSNNKDAEAVAAFYTDDAVRMPAEKPAISGKAAILANIKAEMAADTSNSTIRFEVVNVWAQGNLVVEEGKSITTSATGEESTGKYIAVFEKRDGKYLCVRDIWNDDSDDDDDEESD